jgi:hypothetical protein
MVTSGASTFRVWTGFGGSGSARPLAIPKRIDGLHLGFDRRQELLFHLGPIDLFIHDSLHSERNVRFELDRAWAAMAPKGALGVDDLDGNWDFRSFTLAFLVSNP